MMQSPPPPSASPFGSATGAALDVIVVVPAASSSSPTSPRRRPSHRSKCDIHCQDAGGSGGVVASSDFYVSFPSNMAWTRGGSPPSSSFRKTLSRLYGKSSSDVIAGRELNGSGTSRGERIIEEEEDMGQGAGVLGESNISTHSTMSEMGTSSTEAHHDQPHSRLPSSDYMQNNLPSQQLRTPNRSASTPNRINDAHQRMQQRQANVQIQINGRYVPQLDMIFSSKRGNASTSFLLGASPGGGGSDDEPSCRFVNGNGLRPSTPTLSMLVQHGADEVDGPPLEPTCTCHESIRNGPHHLCDQQTKQSADGQSGPILRNGRNLLRYTLFSKRGLAVATAEAHLYLWKSSDSVIVSDVDGTVTKSDVRGVIDTVIQDRFEYCHPGICKLFHAMIDRGVEDECIDEGEEVILENGAIQHQPGQRQAFDSRGEIRFLYLSSRPISLVSQTRKLLVSLSQTCPITNRLYGLPHGPILCHTGPLTSVLYSELFAKNVHEFKADVLARQVVLPFVAARGEDWKHPHRRNSGSGYVNGNSPGNNADGREEDSGRSWSGLSEASSLWDDRLFLAGFGNKTTDAMAYEMAGIDRRDIYIIDKESRILCMGANENSSEGQPRGSLGHGISDSSEISDANVTNSCNSAIQCGLEDLPLADVCCSGQRESPATVRFDNLPTSKADKDGKAVSTIHSIELSMSEEGRTEAADSVTLTDVDVVVANDSRHHNMRTQSKRSKMKQSIRAFSSKKSFSAKFPSFRSVSSADSKLSTRKLYDGYEDPLLLLRVRERLVG